MTLIKCPVGHWFDSARYPTCPECAGTTLTIDRAATCQTPFAADDDNTVTRPLYVSPGGEVTCSLEDDRDGRTVGAWSFENFDPVVGWLVCMDGSERGRDYRLYTGRNSIGRSAENQVRIVDDATVSAVQHAFIVYEPNNNEFFLSPGRSLQTTLNGRPLERLQSVRLTDGDRIALGRSQFIFMAFCKGEIKW
ncbi:MAG: FHA domain-containing protein [Clostridia bacterium]|nr:FHA domain-containing protein [Clostridia bacterium]